jgi:3-oxoacyl-(acyl-carrier-protein) synthase
MTLNTGIIQPTIHLEQKDAACAANIITDAEESYQYQINCILKLSSGFSGIHSSLIIKKYREGGIHE